METAQATQPRHPTPEELAFVIRSLQEIRQWSQEQLAEISGLSGRTVQRTEKGANPGNRFWGCSQYPKCIYEAEVAAQAWTRLCEPG